MIFDPNTLGEHDLRPLRTLLFDAGYRTEALVERLKLTETEALLADTARNSLLYCDSLGTSPSAILGKLFLFCAPVPIPVLGKLSSSIIQKLYDYGLIQVEADGRHVAGQVSITEFHGDYFLADRLFENKFRNFSVTISHDICMPPHASSFELRRVISDVPRDSTLLDVGSGSGVLSLPLARSAGLVTGIDISGRAIAFARANASLNGVRARFEHTGWERFDPTERYDQILFNSPDESAAFQFINRGLPRFLRRGGSAKVRLVCEALAEDGDIKGAVRRMSTIGPEFDIQVLVVNDSLFSLSREALARGERPLRTLLVEQHSEWPAYIDSLRSRGVAEAASIILDVTSAP
jgi:SAM-dependent methyltransferase